MTKINIPGGMPDNRLGYSKAEKRKLIALAFAFILVLAVFGASYLKSSGSGELDEDLPALLGDVPDEVVDVPTIDTEKFEELVHDRLEEDRVILEGDAIDAALELVRLLTPRHFEALQARELDAAAIAEIMADPAAHRAAPCTVRGWVDSFRTRRRSLTGTEEHIGRLVLEDDSVAYFLTIEMPESHVEGGFVRLDGLFLKAYKEESADVPGEWIDGPLIVGPKLIRSYQPMGEVTEFLPQYMIDLRDEMLIRPDGSINRDIKMGLPFEPTWHALAFVRDLPADAVDWDEAPLLDNALLVDVMERGEEYRLQPFRFPICRVQHATVKRAGENPARIDYFTEGWLGNITWNNVVFFKSPIEDRKARLADFATARGFFFKNFAYESAHRDVRVAPVFILHSLDIFEPKPEPIFAIMAWALSGVTLLFITLFFFQLRRDRRKSKVLQEKLTQRRRARRDKGAEPNSVSTSTP